MSATQQSIIITMLLLLQVRVTFGCSQM